MMARRDTEKIGGAGDELEGFWVELNLTTSRTKDKIIFIWDYNIVSHEYNTRIVYKVTLSYR